MEQKYYVCIDLKSFYASVECIERGLDPLATHLVVADASRTDKTICLAVSPALKACGVPGRPRLFEVFPKVKEVNRIRGLKAPGGVLCGVSCNAEELKANPSLAADFIIAKPRMAQYMQYSSRIFGIYLRHVAPEDIYAYSIDEVFIDITPYLEYGKTTPHDFTRSLLQEVIRETGITATAGIGSNLYLAKVAMDITAKHIPADRDGVRIAELNEYTYRKTLWEHRPLTDFWRLGGGYAKKLEANRLYTMGDIAVASLTGDGEDLLYRLFGVNAELLIDHAWGFEPCTIAQIKSYKPSVNSISTGQVLQCPYDWKGASLIVREMADLLAYDLVEKGVMTDQVTLTVGYDVENLSDPVKAAAYKGGVTLDHYGRAIPKHAHGTQNLASYTSSGKQIVRAMTDIFLRIADPSLSVRRITLSANRILPVEKVREEPTEFQLEMFVDYEAIEERRRKEKAALEAEHRLQSAVLSMKRKYGKNILLKGMNFEEGATARERNQQIGGHRA
ncbi:MAG: DNA methylase [Clostridia bacterium]|nr:DNA methylase [Clostridia bacterium]